MRLKSSIALRKGCKIIWAISVTTNNLHKYVCKKNQPKFESNFHGQINKKNFNHTSTVITRSLTTFTYTFTYILYNGKKCNRLIKNSNFCHTLINVRQKCRQHNNKWQNNFWNMRISSKNLFNYSNIIFGLNGK